MSTKSLVELIRAGDLAGAREALAAGADPDLKAKGGWTPLMAAAATGRRDLVELLLDAGADPNPNPKERKNRPLQFAAWEDHLDIVRLLLARGADASRQFGRSIDTSYVNPHNPNAREILRILKGAANAKRKGRNYARKRSMSVKDLNGVDIVMIFVQAPVDAACDALMKIAGLGQRKKDVYDTQFQEAGRWYLVARLNGQRWTFLTPIGDDVPLPDELSTLALGLSREIGTRTVFFQSIEADDIRYQLYEAGRLLEQLDYASPAEIDEFLATSLEEKKRNPFVAEAPSQIAEKVARARPLYESLRRRMLALRKVKGISFSSPTRTLTQKQKRSIHHTVDTLLAENRIYLPLVPHSVSPPDRPTQLSFSDYQPNDFDRCDAVGRRPT